MAKSIEPMEQREESRTSVRTVPSCDRGRFDQPTPVLKGDDAYEFVARMEQKQKASAEEKERVAKGVSFI